jgi:hypothetical protein
MAANLKAYEIGEIHIYKALILAESGDTAAAIHELKSN